MCAEPVAEVIELRCDAGKLLANVLRSGERPQYVHPDNLIELSCDGCRARRRREGRRVARVLHRFNILGELIETLIIEE